MLPSAVPHRLRPAAAPRLPPAHSSPGRSSASGSRSDARHRAATPTSRRRALAGVNQRERSFWEGRGHRAALAAARTRARGSLARLSQRERALARCWHSSAASALPFLPGQLYAPPLSPLTWIPLVLPQLLLTTLIDSVKNQHHRWIRLITALPSVPFLMPKTGFNFFPNSKIDPQRELRLARAAAAPGAELEGRWGSPSRPRSHCCLDSKLAGAPFPPPAALTRR